MIKLWHMFARENLREADLPDIVLPKWYNATRDWKIVSTEYKSLILKFGSDWANDDTGNVPPRLERPDLTWVDLYCDEVDPARKYNGTRRYICTKDVAEKIKILRKTLARLHKDLNEVVRDREMSPLGQVIFDLVLQQRE